MCISCETDFVSKNAEFVAFAQSIADAALSNNVKSAEELNAVEITGAKVSDMINDKLAAIGEKIGDMCIRDSVLIVCKPNRAY